MANIIDDQLPGGPQWIENMGHDPVWVEDKSQLKKELKARNLEPLIRSDKTPQPSADDPRFAPNGWRQMQAPIQPTVGRVGLSAQYVPRSHMQLLSNFAATWGQMTGPRFGIHCQKCGQDVQGHNLPSATTLVVKCGCSEYVCEAR